MSTVVEAWLSVVDKMDVDEKIYLRRSAVLGRYLAAQIRKIDLNALAMKDER